MGEADAGEGGSAGEDPADRGRRGRAAGAPGGSDERGTGRESGGGTAARSDAAAAGVKAAAAAAVAAEAEEDDAEGTCAKEVAALLRCVSSKRYANISSCKEEMRALRKCCVDEGVREFAVVRECGAGGARPQTAKGGGAKADSTGS